MALSPAERAILELSLKRGLDHGAIEETAGVGRGEVQALARAALVSLTGSDAGSPLAEYLTGTADQRQRTRALELLSRDPRANAQALRLAAALREELGPLAEPAIPRLRDRPAPGRGVVLAAVALAMACVAVALVVTRSGSSDEPVDEPAAAPMAGDEGERQFVEVSMRPPTGSGPGTGRAEIGLTEEYEPFLDIELEGLRQPPSGTLYILWVDLGNGRGIPLPAPIAVSPDGSSEERFPLAVPLIGVLDVGSSLDVVRVDQGELQELSRQVAGGVQQGDEAELAPRHPGGVVLTGQIPRGAS